ncbi:hypothetical protein MVEN_01977100 [Mycena venus]|uniref:DUF6534 domain-containing protein n=1 Tax=Mycena venus TaxID=2733690 RepID=A0A8H7CIK2_9AGAR|nr:hypothetical protein MVEN_01977100 [Mycena venus]
MSTVGPSNPATPPIVQVSGPLLLVYLLNWGLFWNAYGSNFFYLAFPRDKRSNKILVYTVYLIELVQTVWLTHDAFAIFGYGFADFSAPDEGLLRMVVGSGDEWLSQSFYAYRVYVLSGSRIIPFIIVTIALTSSVAAFITGAFTFEDSSKRGKNKISLVIWCGGSALDDMIIAVCMTYFLTKRDTGFNHTNVLVSKLTRLIIETGTFTAVVALSNVALYLAFPDRSYFTTPGGILPKLYANTILVVLNSRIAIVGGRGSDTTSGTTSSRSYRRTATANGEFDSQQPSLAIVSIRRNVFTSEADLHEGVEMKVMDDPRIETSA